jgi:hypothetical protein
MMGNLSKKTAIIVSIPVSISASLLTVISFGASMPRWILFPRISRIVIVLLSSLTSFHRIETMWLAERVVEVFEQEGQSTWTRNWKKRHEKGIFV